MPELLSEAAVKPKIYDEFPTFADYIVESWDPEPNGEVEKHKNALGKTYASTETDPGETVQGKLAVKDTKEVPANHTVLTATFPGPTTKKYIVTGIKTMREGPLTKFTATFEFKESMPDPA